MNYKDKTFVLRVNLPEIPAHILKVTKGIKMTN